MDKVDKAVSEERVVIGIWQRGRQCVVSSVIDLCVSLGLSGGSGGAVGHHTE